MGLVSVAGIPVWALILLVSGVTSEGSASDTGSKSSYDFEWEPVIVQGYMNLNWKKEENGRLTLHGPDKHKYIGAIASKELNFPKACLTFSKQIMGDVYATLEVAVANDLKSEREILWLRAEHLFEMEKVNVPINRAKGFIVIVTGYLGDGRKDEIFIEDFDIVEGECPTSEKDDSLLCNFEEEGFCGWSSSAGNYEWTIERGYQYLAFFGYRIYSKAFGYYAKVNAVSSQTGQSTDDTPVRLTSPQLKGGDKKQCLRMYYLLSGGVDSGTFTIKAEKDDEKSTEVFKVVGTQGIQWREALVTLDKTPAYKIVIEYTPGPDRETMAIDNITIFDEPCPLFDLDVHVVDKPITCSIDTKEDGCKFTSVPYLGQKFEIGKDPTIPLPAKITPGKVATYKVETLDPEFRSIATLTSDMYSTNSKRNCLTFYYSIKSLPKVTLLRVYTSANLRQYIWERVHLDTNGWRKGMVEFETMKNYKIEFAALITVNSTGSVEVGGYQLANAACPTESTGTYMCNFDEETICGWEVNENEGSTWIRETPLDSSLLKHKTDHSTYSGTGYYMLFKPSDSSKGKPATLMSPKFKAIKGSSYCFTFWYNIVGRHPGQLEVYLQKNNVKATESTLLWSANKGRSAVFFLAQVDIPGDEITGDVQIYFSAFVDKQQKGYIAIDDVSFEEGACAKF